VTIGEIGRKRPVYGNDHPDSESGDDTDEDGTHEPDCGIPLVMSRDRFLTYFRLTRRAGRDRLARMAHILRLQCPDAIHHVMKPGDRRERAFLDDADCCLFAPHVDRQAVVNGVLRIGQSEDLHEHRHTKW
jgi:hypothetical protein